jgi:hypothetical protein
MKKQRKHYTPEEKVAILRRHLLEKEPISKLCESTGAAHGLLSRAEGVLSRMGRLPSSRKRGRHSAEQEPIAYLEKKIQTKDRSWPSSWPST